MAKGTRPLVFCRLIFVLSFLVGENFGDGAVDSSCFDESCGRKYDPKGPLVHCNYL